MSDHIFAFGSNMCSARFRSYGVTPEGVGRAACLPGHRLLFNKWSKKDQSGKANVEPDPAAEVWGVVYSIPTGDLEVLDRGEGPGYERVLMPVRASEQQSMSAWVYCATEGAKRDGARPFLWYREFLIAGAKEHSLPVAYIAALEAIPADKDPDQARDAQRRELM